MKGLFIAIVALMTLASAQAQFPCAGFCSPDRAFPLCEFGGEPTGPCGCQQRCFKGPGEVCGWFGGYLGKCSDEFFCDKSWSQGGGFGFNPIGMCRRKQTSPCFVPCSLVRCAAPSNCRYGIGKNVCGCCDVCLKGPGETCGRFASCGRGFFCRTNPGAEDSEGVCSPFLFPPLSGPRRRRFRGSPFTTF